MRCDDDSDVPYQTCIETMEAVRSLMKRISEKSSIESGARCIFDCVVKVEAEMSAFAVKPAAIDLKVPPTVSSCATAVKAVQQVVGVESVKTGTNKPVGVKFEPAVVKAVQQVNKPVGVKPVEPSVSQEQMDMFMNVESKPGSEPTMVSVSDPVKAAGFTSIFVVVPKTVTVDQLQVIFGVEAKIGRRRKNRKFVKVFVPDNNVGRVLKLDISVSGHKLPVLASALSPTVLHTSV